MTTGGTFYVSFAFRSMNGFIPSYFTSFSQPNLLSKISTNNTTVNGHPPGLGPKGNQMATHLSGHGHRRLPATPNKPSTLFTQTASMAFHNFSHQFTKPNTLTFRPPPGGNNYSSPGYGAFSFPKLNGSPSRPSHGMAHNGPNHLGGVGGQPGGSGSGFMGFGPTGFTTPIDTVLDRFGRTGTIFPSVSNYGNGTGPPYGMMHNGPVNLHNGHGPPPGVGNSVGPPGPAPAGPHRTLPPMVNRSNSLGRSLPPIPSKPPPLVRRRTFEDEEDRRMDWIW